MRESFVRQLIRGQLDLDRLSPFPLIEGGRLRQLEPLLDHIRQPSSPASGVTRLREWDLLSRASAWPTPMLVRVVRELAYHDLSAALSCIAHMALGVRLVRQFGTEAQVRALSGKPAPVFGFALTEASPGSDVSQIQTFARPVGDRFVLTGTKQWVTNAVEATRLIVVARTVPPHAADKPRLTAFIVAPGPGLEVKPVPSDVLPGAGVGDVLFHDLEVPAAAQLGALGKGFRVVMHGLAEARLLVGAAVLGGCIKAFDETIARLNQRRAFGRPVGNFPSVQDRVSGMLADLLAVESLVHGASGADDLHQTADPVERAVVRLAASRAAARVLAAARELHGAAAFAGRSEAARRWTDTRAISLLDGSDLALESFIVLEGTRGMRHRAEAMADSSNTLMRVEALRLQTVDRFKGRLSRALTRSVPGARVPALQKAVATLGDTVRQQMKKHGPEIIEMQHVQRRLASIIVDVCTWYCLAARLQTEVSRHGEVGSRRMVEAARIWVSSAEERIDLNFRGIEANDDAERDRIANRAYADIAYPFDVC